MKLLIRRGCKGEMFCDVASRSDSREIQLQCFIRGISVLPSSIVHGWLSGTTDAKLLFAQISGTAQRQLKQLVRRDFQ